MSDDTTQPTDVNETTAEDEATESPYGVAVEDAGALKKKVTVTIPRKLIDEKFNELYGELGYTAQVPGFRVGHAPRRLLEKRFGNEVGDDVRNNLIGESIGQAIEQADLRTLGEPDLKLDEIKIPDAGDMDYSFEVEVAPEFELPETKGIALDKPLLEVTDERVDAYVDRLQNSRATFEDSDAPAAAGDMVTVNAAISGEGCDPVQRKDVELRVGPSQVEGLALVDLGDTLAGKSAGETVSLTTTAQAAHPNEQWREKELTVALELTKVQARKVPDVDDEFAKGHGFDSLADMREFFADEMGRRIGQDQQQAIRGQLCKHLLDSTEFDLPEGVAARHSQQALQRRYVELLQRGIPREQIDENLTQLAADAANQARQELKLSFVLGKVADDAGIEIGEDEINARIAQMAQSYNRRPEKLKQELTQDGSLEQVAVSLREEKALDLLIEQAHITELSAEEFDKKHNPAAAEGAEKKTAKKKTAKKATKKAAKKADEKSDGDKADEAGAKAKKTTKKKTAKKAAKKAAKKTTAKKAAKKTAKKSDASSD